MHAFQSRLHLMRYCGPALGPVPMEAPGPALVAPGPAPVAPGLASVLQYSLGLN